MKFRPLHDRVVVKRLESDEKTAGGIIIPDTAKDILKCSYLAISATKQIILNEYKVDFSPSNIESSYSEVKKLRNSNHFEIGKTAFANKKEPEWD